VSVLILVLILVSQALSHTPKKPFLPELTHTSAFPALAGESYAINAKEMDR
jgi:hypothetical protein